MALPLDPVSLEEGDEVDPAFVVVQKHSPQLEESLFIKVSNSTEEYP